MKCSPQIVVRCSCCARTVTLPVSGVPKGALLTCKDCGHEMLLVGHGFVCGERRNDIPLKPAEPPNVLFKSSRAPKEEKR